MKKITIMLDMNIAFEQKFQIHRKEGYTRISLHKLDMVNKMLYFINASTEETP